MAMEAGAFGPAHKSGAPTGTVDTTVPMINRPKTRLKSKQKNQKVFMGLSSANQAPIVQPQIELQPKTLFSDSTG